MQLKRIYIRNKKCIVVYGLITFALLAMVANHIVWLSNMYDLFEQEFKANVNETVQEAICMEFAERCEMTGSVHLLFSHLSLSGDTPRLLDKGAAPTDSSYAILVDSTNPDAMHKISQLALKSSRPIDLDRLGVILKDLLRERYAVDDVCFDYFDLKADTLIRRNCSVSMLSAGCFFTDTIPLDIVSSTGIIGCVGNVRAAILDNMRRQLILSVIFIVTGVIALFYVSRGFVFQWQAEKMRRSSVNFMTHEFKRPISRAMSLLCAIPCCLEKRQTDKVLNYVDNIRSALHRLDCYTKRIQQMSNDEGDIVALDIVAVEIAPFLESLRQQYLSKERLSGKVRIRLHFATSKKTMNVDLHHFSNTMVNLMENAVKYTISPTIIIDISARDAAGGKLQIAVRDNGIGISPVDRKRVFDAFYRIRRTETSNTAGFGLGLAYVKTIVEAHGGEIAVNSELNKGSEFIITLNG